MSTETDPRIEAALARWRAAGGDERDPESVRGLLRSVTGRQWDAHPEPVHGFLLHCQALSAAIGRDDDGRWGALYAPRRQGNEIAPDCFADIRSALLSLAAAGVPVAEALAETRPNPQPDASAGAGDWYCPGCGVYLSPSRVTQGECCDTCHTPVEWHTAAQMDTLAALRARVAKTEAALAAAVREARRHAALHEAETAARVRAETDRDAAQRVARDAEARSERLAAVVRAAQETQRPGVGWLPVLAGVRDALAALLPAAEDGEKP